MDTFRGGPAATPGTVEEGYRRRVMGMDPGALMSILIILVIIILLLMLFNMSSDSDSDQSSPSPNGGNRTNRQATFFNPLNNTMRNNPVVTTATTTRAL